MQELEQAEKDKNGTKRAAFRMITVERQKLSVLGGEDGNIDLFSVDTDNYI